MRLQPSAALLRDIWERGDSTLLRQRLTATALAGGVANATVSPPVGFEWLVMHVGTDAEFAALPGAGNIAVAGGAVFAAGQYHWLVGVRHHAALSAGNITRVREGTSALVVLDSTDAFRVEVSAVGAAVNVVGAATLLGYEFRPL